MNVIEARGLGKHYGSTQALRECTLAIPAGHVAALVGPNGAGKSTLLEPGSRAFRRHRRAASPFSAVVHLGRSPPWTASRSSPRTRRSTRPCQLATCCT